MLAVDTSMKGAVTYRPTGQMQHSPDPKRTLVQTALKLFASRGYHAVSIADIVRESGCTRGTLYYHFSSKEELGYAVIDEEMRLLAEQGVAAHMGSDKHPIDRLIKMLEEVPNTLQLKGVGLVEVGIAARMAAVHEGFRQRLTTRAVPLIEQCERMVAKGIADGQIADSVDPVQLTHFALAASYGLQMVKQLGQEQLLPDGSRGWIKKYLNSLRR
jgi:TetR/AcrR family transcriptional repressor of nem operon